MADKEIRFSPPMVRALLAGTKTQTRRLLMKADEIAKGPWLRSRFNAETGAWQVGLERFNSWKKVPVRYAIGDHLYVREHWRVHFVHDRTAPSDLPPWTRPIIYVADEADGSYAKSRGKLRQAMHMPRWASRLTLLVTDVRVQRLQDISEEDAKAEGVSPKLFGADHGREYTRAYITLWDSLNSERALWSTNPWIVAYTFEVNHGNIDTLKGATT